MSYGRARVAWSPIRLVYGPSPGVTIAPPPHLRITFSGTLGSVEPGVEIFSFGLSAAGAIGGDWLEAKTNDERLTLAEALAARWSTIAVNINQAVRLKRVRVAAVGVDGKTLRTGAGAYAHADAEVNLAGVGNGTTLPFQSALVVSLRSPVAGPTGRGRFYLPVPNVITSHEDGLISLSNIAPVTANVGTFLGQVQDELAAWSPGVGLVIASGGSPLRAIPPAASPVVEYGVGRVVDTMRSRRNALEESQNFSPLP